MFCDRCRDWLGVHCLQNVVPRSADMSLRLLCFGRFFSRAFKVSFVSSVHVTLGLFTPQALLTQTGCSISGVPWLCYSHSVPRHASLADQVYMLSVCDSSAVGVGNSSASHCPPSYPVGLSTLRPLSVGWVRHSVVRNRSSTDLYNLDQSFTRITGIVGSRLLRTAVGLHVVH